MPNTLADGQKVQVKGSGSSMYTLHRSGDVYSCTCPAWLHQGTPIDFRTCKHLRAYFGDAVETARIGSAAPFTQATRTKSAKASAGDDDAKAPPVLLAHKWETDHDPTGWWMSEKLDGIRAYWDGEGFVSRLGNKFYAPDWFIADLPADTLDGELWVGRKMFQKTTSIVRSGAQSDAWKQVSYVVFDAPNATGGFEERLAHAQKVLKRAAAPHARWLEHVVCDSFEHLRGELARVEALGGEGLMLRRPKSSYEVGRSHSLLKVKTFHDAEARVVGHAPGTGKHKGRLGALICELSDGTRFNAGTGLSDAERDDPPNLGSVITFRYQELSDDGVPRFPSYVGERLDVKTPAAIGTCPGSLASLGPGAREPRSNPNPNPPNAGGTSKPAGGATLAASKPATKPLSRPAPAAAPPPSAATPVAAAPAAKASGKAPKITTAVTTTVGGFRVSLVHHTEQKFWEIEVRGTAHYTRFGKVGSTGQTRLVELGSATAAQSDADKRAQQKRKEGYSFSK